MTALTVRRVGPLAALEDHGRSGLAHLGVGHAGAADRTAYDLANRLVGNHPGAACIEATLGLVEVVLEEPALMAVTGAEVEVRCGARVRAVNSSFWVPADTPLSLSSPRAGLRSYLAVRGGLVGARVLGSVSWDTMAQLGHPPLQPGDRVDIGTEFDRAPAADLAPVRAIGAEPLELPLILGPRDDWFTDEAISRLAECDFTVTTDTDRVGARLEGPHLTRAREGELASEGVVLGAVQVPTRGRPTIFLADHPVTGGYPVIGVVPGPWVDMVAQAAPGRVIHFHPKHPR